MYRPTPNSTFKRNILDEFDECYNARGHGNHAITTHMRQTNVTSMSVMCAWQASGYLSYATAIIKSMTDALESIKQYVAHTSNGVSKHIGA